jgi:hypothetical protein
MKRICIAALLATLVGRAGADEIVEPATGQKFAAERTLAGRPLMLLGTGARKKLYAMALYVDDQDARRNFSALVARSGGRERSRLLDGDHAQTFVIWGGFTKLALLRATDDVHGEQLRDELRDGLTDELSDKAAAEVKQAAESFIALFDKDLKAGDEIQLRSDADGHIFVEISGQKKHTLASAKLARAIWNIWLGQKPISPEMRRSLVNRVDVLGK